MRNSVSDAGASVGWCWTLETDPLTVVAFFSSSLSDRYKKSSARHKFLRVFAFSQSVPHRVGKELLDRVFLQNFVVGGPIRRWIRQW